MPTINPTPLEAAQTRVTELERDRNRIDTLTTAANDAANTTRHDPEKMLEHSTRAAGLTHARNTITADLNAARAHLAELEADHAQRNATTAYETARTAHAQAEQHAKHTAREAALTIHAEILKIRTAMKATATTAEQAQRTARAAGHTNTLHHPMGASTLRIDAMMPALAGLDNAQRISLALSQWLEDPTIHA